MPNFPRGDHPDAVLKVFWCLTEKQAAGGATMEELQSAYETVKGRFPDEKTIRRMIARINELYDPLSKSNKRSDQLIIGKKYNDDYRYLLSQKNTSAPDNRSLAMQLLISLYPHKLAMPVEHFQQISTTIFNEALRLEQSRKSLEMEMKKHVFVCGTHPANPEMLSHIIFKVLEAIRDKKRIRFDYLRIYDGEEQKKRELNAYGFLCRQDVWYIVGCAPGRKELRIFRCDQIKNLSALPSYTYTIPEDFSLKETYGHSWGTWTTDPEKRNPVLVRLLVDSTMAKRFNETKYHASQKVTPLPSGDIEVEFRVIEPKSEMLPWLMGWSDSIEVLEPPDLRAALCERLEAMLAKHRQ